MNRRTDRPVSIGPSQLLRGSKTKSKQELQKQQTTTENNISKFHFYLINPTQDILKMAYLGTKHDVI